MERGFIYVWLSAFLFTILFLLLSFFNKPAVDDFHFLYNVHQFGVWKGILYEYATWSPRYVAVFVTHLTLLVEEKTHFGYLIFGVLSFGLTILAIHQFLKTASQFRIWDMYLESDFLNKKHFFISSLFFCSCWFLATLKIGETWFWLCSASTYLWSNAFFLILFSVLFKQKATPYHFVILFICTLYIGGSCGPLSLLSLFVLLSLITAGVFVRKSIFTNRHFMIRLIFSFILLGIFFFVQYNSQGNRIRETFFKEINLGESLLLNLKMMGIIIFKRLPFSFIIGLTLTFPLFSVVPKKTIPRYEKWFRCVCLSLFVYGVLLFLFQLSVTYKTQDVAAYRTLFFVNTLTLLFCAWFWILCSKYGVLLTISNYLKRLKVAVLAIYTFILVCVLFQQAFTVTNYARAYHERMLYIRNHCVEGEIINLNPLPPSGFLFSAELSSDTAHFSNNHFRKALNLKCYVRKGVALTSAYE
jgi:hypothetical protein